MTLRITIVCVLSRFGTQCYYNIINVNVMIHPLSWYICWKIERWVYIDVQNARSYEPIEKDIVSLRSIRKQFFESSNPIYDLLRCFIRKIGLHMNPHLEK